MNDNNLRESMAVMDRNFPVIFHRDTVYHTSRFRCHWHETLEFLFFIKGEAVVHCNSKPIAAEKGDLVIINGNELHQIKSQTARVEYYCIIVDMALFQGKNPGYCETKYINPINENRILFNNKVEKDKKVSQCFRNLIREMETRETGFELAVKAHVFHLMALLLRSHVQRVLTKREYSSRMKNLERFTRVLEYMETQYGDRITLNDLAELCNISRFHFCRSFKNAVGMSPGDYLNEIRIRKAEQLMKEQGLNVTEAAMACGFNTVNYFSRLYKKYRSVPPSSAAEQENSMGSEL